MRKYFIILSTATFALSACNNNEPATTQDNKQIVANSDDSVDPAKGSAAEDAVGSYSNYTLAKQKMILDRQAAGEELSAEDKEFLAKHPPRDASKNEGEKKIGK